MSPVNTGRFKEIGVGVGVTVFATVVVLLIVNLNREVGIISERLNASDKLQEHMRQDMGKIDDRLRSVEISIEVMRALNSQDK